MIEISLQINKDVLLNWLAPDMANMSQEKFAEEISVDPGNFSKMLDGKITTPKHVLEKTIARTMLPIGQILISVPKND